MRLDALDRMLSVGAASLTCVRPSSPRSWGGLQIRLFTDRDPHPSDRSILPRKRTDVLSRGVGMCRRSIGHAAPCLSGPRQLDALQQPFVPPAAPVPSIIGVLGELTLSHNATTGVAAYAVDPAASNSAFYIRCDDTKDVTLSYKPQMLAVNLMRSSGSRALTGHCFVDILPQPNTLSEQKHFVASTTIGVSVLGVEDLKPGDLVGVADAALLPFPLNPLQHPAQAAGLHPGQTSDSQVSAVASSTDAEGIAPAVTPPSPTLIQRSNPAKRSAF